MDTSLTINDLGTILGLWAHPDDEVFSSAGLMMRAIQNGQRVIVITATHGDAGKTADEEKWPQKALTSIRTQELHASLDILGAKEHYWLNYKDGLLKDIPTETAVQDITNILKDVAPDTIVTFEEHGITGHEDHKTVHRWTKELVNRLKKEAKVLCATECREYYESVGKELDRKYDIYFNTDQPRTVSKSSCDLCVELTVEERLKKLEAIAAHESQTSAMFRDEVSRAGVELLCECECFELL